jgi:glycine/D-amino acid oxidase-like deaminating enzyme
MRVVVVGSGVIGLLTAVECVLAGAEVDLVEQAGTIPSTSATSYDRQRVVRALHRGDPRLTRAAAGLAADWRAVELLLGRPFYHRTGVLTVGPAAELQAELALLTELGVAAEPITAASLAARYPQLRFTHDDQAILESAAGTVLADQALLAAAWWLRGRPEVLCYPGSQVIRVTESGAVVLAGGDVLGGDAVLVAAGPWSRALLPIPVANRLTLKRQTMLSYQGFADWPAAPAVLGLGNRRDAWLMPPVAGRPPRLSAASACRSVALPAGAESPDEWREHLIGRFGGLISDFEPAAVTATDGYYLTEEAGQGPLLVQLGESRVWAYAACGGMSFKFAPVLARAFADRALGRPPRPTGLAAVDQPEHYVAARRELFI